MNPPRQVEKHGRKRWLVDLRENGAGRRYFETESAAKHFVSEMLADQETHGQLAFDLPPNMRRRYLALDHQATEAGTTLEEALEWWKKTHRPMTRKVLGEALLDCLSAKRAAGRRERSMRQLGYTLDAFKKSVGLPGMTVADITHAQVEQFLANAEWQIRTRKNRLTDLRTFFSFCLKRGWCLTDPTAAVESITVDEKPPGILTVDQSKRLLDATKKAAPSFLPFIVLGLFCGVRPDEIKQLSWQQVNLETRYVEIPAAIAKRVKGGSRQRRLIKLQPNAIAWLKLGGDLPPVSWQDRWDEARQAAGFSVAMRTKRGQRKRCDGEPWPKNAMRHSFCSYCLPIFGELKESEWAGHSPAIAIQRYRELVTEEESKKFWAILPAPS